MRQSIKNSEMNWKFRDQVFFGLACLGAFFLLLTLYGYAPGMAPASAASLSDISFAECLRNQPHIFTLRCENSGYPLGDPSTFGLPVHLLIAFASDIVPSPITALRLSYSMLLGLALVGCLAFFLHFARNLWLALLGSLLFLASPIVSLEGGYGPLRIGFALLPTYVAINLWVIAKIKCERNPQNLPLAGFWTALIAVHTFALFCDGYSFVMDLGICGLLWAGWLWQEWRRGHLRAAWRGVAIAVSSPVLAIALYKAYIPTAHYEPMPLGFFRGQGVDLFMLAMPAASNWLADVTGWHHHVTPYQVYSDGPSSSLVYIGYSFLACSVICVIALFRNRFADKKTIILILSAGTVGFLLSLGPALKIHDFRPPGPGDLAFNAYLMPAGRATAELGTGWIYEHAPGIKVMRALYRWDLLLRLALVLAAVLTLKLLMVRRRLFLLSILAAVLMLDTLPSLPRVVSSGQKSLQTLRDIAAGPAQDLRHHLHGGEKVVFVQLHAAANQNEYLASYLCATADLTCYNVGGDKATVLASEKWPTAVYELISGDRIETNALDVFRTDLAEVIAIPLFDLRTQAYAWPPIAFPREDVIKRAQALFADYDIQPTKWYVFVRPKQMQLWKHVPAEYREGQIANVAAWGPKVLHGHPVAGTYLWVKLPNANDSIVLTFGNHRLPTLKNSPTVLAAPIREVDLAALPQNGLVPVYLADPKRQIKQQIGVLTIEAD